MTKPFTAVDLFAGVGGWTTGATQGGAQVLMTINHWPRAMARACLPELRPF